MRRRKRVALFANGWARECLQEVGYGISRCAEETDTDLFAFINYSVHVSSEEELKGEFNIFLLPDLEDFDGVLLLSNSFNQQRETDYLHREVQRTGVPAISLEYELEGLPYFGSDNYQGMYELARHIILEHGARRIMFIGGIKGHEDSEIRLRALRDAAGESGIQISEEDILYGSWSETVTPVCLDQWKAKKREMPDAVICANDIMAIAVCEWLKEQGYRVPKDIVVTGYDCIERGQKHSPVITSINREWVGLGYRALQALLGRLEGKEIPAREIIKSHPVYGESCGCRRREETDGGGQNPGRAPSVKKIDGVTSDQHFRHMYTSVRKAAAIEDFHDSLSDFIEKEGFIEGQNFMLCIHPNFFDMEQKEEIFRQPGYSREMDVICSLHDGRREPYQRLSKREAMFRAAERSEKAGSYLFVPVRSDDMNLGFAMLTRDFEVVSDFMLYIWTRHVNQYMEQIFSNVKIEELTRKLRQLSVTDVLTGLYNRMGCEKILYPMMERCQRRGGRGVVMLADVDRMKTINDRYGHAQGDLALQTVAEVLKTGLPEGFLAGRFGGDEFFIVGERDGEVSIEELAKQLSGQLARIVEQRQLEFSLTMSVGGIQLKPGEEFRLNDCIQKADEFMYRVKKEHHRNAEEP